MAVGAAVILTPKASAGTDHPPSPEVLTLENAMQLGPTFESDLGVDKTAGWYYDDKDHRLVVNVLDRSTAARVKAKGAVPRIVKKSKADLTDVTRALSSTVVIPGTSWSIDPQSNKVSVVADRSVTGPSWDKLTAVTHDLGDSVTVQRSGESFERFALGGDTISGHGICSLGFNVTANGAPAFLTAGHCGRMGETLTTHDGAQGTVVASGFPARDYALVKYNNPSVAAPSAVHLPNGTTQQITQAAEATMGMHVTTMGERTGAHSGVVTGLNATVTYQGESSPTYGLIRTNLCTDHGDSGGALFSGNSAIGLTSGGSGCVTYYQPVTTTLQATGAKLGTSGGTVSAPGGGTGGSTGGVAGGAGTGGTTGGAGRGGSAGGRGTGSAAGGSAGGGSGGSPGGGRGAVGAGTGSGSDCPGSTVTGPSGTTTGGGSMSGSRAVPGAGTGTNPGRGVPAGTGSGSDCPGYGGGYGTNATGTDCGGSYGTNATGTDCGGSYGTNADSFGDYGGGNGGYADYGSGYDVSGGSYADYGGGYGGSGGYDAGAGGYADGLG